MGNYGSHRSICVLNVLNCVWRQRWSVRLLVQWHLIDDLGSTFLDSALSIVAVKSSFFFGFEQLHIELLVWINTGAMNSCAEKWIISARIIDAVYFYKTLSESQAVLRSECALFKGTNGNSLFRPTVTVCTGHSPIANEITFEQMAD